MAKKLKIGIIGMSKGNGHPYSWSAIFNGYDEKAMQDCPFPGIPDYLSKRNFPEDGLQELGEVTHIWTQDIEVSEQIAAASKITHVTKDMEEMIGKIDAVLLARDDAENHLEMARPFIEAGLPIFIDKPLALTSREAEEILALEKFDGQIFTCSAMRYADELMLTEEDKQTLGKILYVEASVMKEWNTYGIHLLEPFVFQLEDRGKLESVFSIKNTHIQQTLVKWENSSAYLKVTGEVFTPYSLSFFGEEGSVTKEFTDAFSCFKNALREFVHQIGLRRNKIERDETLELIRILELGRV